MCFSATASFVSSAVLFGLGVVAVRKSRKSKLRSFAAIPHMFGIQQLAEGFVWLGLQNEQFEPYLDVSTYGFLIFAWIIWPLYVPYAIRRAEIKVSRRRLLNLIEIVGGLVAVALLYVLVSKGVTPGIRGHNIHYFVHYNSGYASLLSVLYLICTVLPPFVSSRRKVWVLGVVTVVMYALAKLYFEQHLLSVWCFFAAIGSLVILWLVYHDLKGSKASEHKSDKPI
jgi:hypothetical protein